MQVPAHRYAHSSFLSYTWLLLLIILVSIIAGAASALFLSLLDATLAVHHQYPSLLYLLPVAGVVLVWFYRKWGENAGQGSHLLLEEIHELEGKVPLRMAPMVLIGTLITHLFGGSAGREGTAVQMAGSLAAWLSRHFLVPRHFHRILLMSGIAAGFASVFGTPWAAAIFAIEIPIRGSWQWRYFLATLLAAMVGHFTCLAWGIDHTNYRHSGLSFDGFHQWSGWKICCVIIAGIACGLVSRLFVWMTHTSNQIYVKITDKPLLRPFIGGVLVIMFSWAIGSRDYLGLGVTSADGGVSILSSFTQGGATPWSWFWKILFTVITLGCGFKGGEVTPLFFIGATLGNLLGTSMDQSVALFAGMGMIAVFAGAANAPLTCAILGVELFGPHYAAAFALVCLCSYLVSGKSCIYKTQR